MVARVVLVLGGTGEARRLAVALGEVDGLRVVSSLAGRVREPLLPVGEVRVGGFGGVRGLVDWLRERAVDLVVDATHPFAAIMTGNAAAATAELGLPLLVLRRPGWTEQVGDRWHWVSSIGEAAALLPSVGRRVLLTTGRRDLPAFANPELWFLSRSVDPPENHPDNVEILLDRGPYTVDGELELLRRQRIEVLVTKDSGGEQTAAKLTAARRLGVPVVIVRRPPVPAADTVATVAAAVEWVRRGSGVG
ncbi:cobalt-precorrin-6A reductase [Crossiella cryophila]|uniref:cobalt-precorrin-6A reductase n=1 Tax=Crossiella cryophila TaxID=43355 RepID=UPI001614C151|nr:cobalt-precorrin-6A reductase [Crossiella cryophila]